MEDKEKAFFRKVNVDKAKNKVKLPIIISIISLLTYVGPLLDGEYDFGIIFEIISLILILVARNYMLKYDEMSAKRYVVFAMLPIGWLLVYDFLLLCSATKDLLGISLLGVEFVYYEVLSIINIIALFDIYKNLAKVENPEKYKESTDWFYETYEEKEEK